MREDQLRTVHDDLDELVKTRDKLTAYWNKFADAVVEQTAEEPYAANKEDSTLRFEILEAKGYARFQAALRDGYVEYGITDNGGDTPKATLRFNADGRSELGQGWEAPTHVLLDHLTMIMKLCEIAFTPPVCDRVRSTGSEVTPLTQFRQSAHDVPHAPTSSA